MTSYPCALTVPFSVSLVDRNFIAYALTRCHRRMNYRAVNKYLGGWQLRLMGRVMLSAGNRSGFCRHHPGTRQQLYAWPGPERLFHVCVPAAVAMPILVNNSPSH